MSKIHEFYAVTRTSVYRVTDEIYDRWPLVEKIMVNGKSGVRVGDRLKNGDYIGITKYAVCLFVMSPARGRERPDMINTAKWGGTTTSPTALFLDREEALRCLNTSDRKDWDQRWRGQTEEVIRAIGDNHPIFILGSDVVK